MPRKLIYNKSPQTVSASDQVQLQATKSGALRATNGDADVYTVTFSLDTSAYASADLVADTQAVSTTAFDQEGGTIVVDSVVILDEDDQGVALNLVFIQDSTSLGTENAAPTITDADARKIIGVVPIATGDYLDIGGSKIATVRNVGLTLKAASGSQALYVAIVNGSGTPTFTATGLQAMIAVRQL